MASTRLVIDGYGQIELNNVAFRRDGRIVAQCALDTVAFASVKAENGIDDRGGCIFGAQLLGGFPGLRQAVLGHGQIDIIIDMAVTGCKVAVGNTQWQSSAQIGVFHNTNRHV